MGHPDNNSPTKTSEQRGPFPDANTFPYPRLCVPTMKPATNYPRYLAGTIEYTYYEKELVTVGDKTFLAWKEIKQR